MNWNDPDAVIKALRKACPEGKPWSGPHPAKASGARRYKQMWYGRPRGGKQVMVNETRDGTFGCGWHFGDVKWIMPDGERYADNPVDPARHALRQIGLLPPEEPSLF